VCRLGSIAAALLALPAVFLTPLMTLFLQRSQPPKVDARDIVDDITNPTFEVESTSVCVHNTIASYSSCL
jgi:hypothetical protein